MLIILNGYPDIFKEKYTKIFRQKLGIDHSKKKHDVYLIGTMLQMMSDKGADFTLTFRQLSNWKLEDIKSNHVPKHLWAINTLSSHKKFTEWTKHYGNAIEDGHFEEGTRKSNMDKINPRYVLRNWIAQDVIAKAERSNFDLLHKVHIILQRPFVEQEEAELLGFADPPPDWAKKIRVSCSS